ncbi:MAG: putative membrane protein YqiK [Myxococcota bacterium]|jgi:uncharacterized membrane protein YqiK
MSLMLFAIIAGFIVVIMGGAIMLFSQLYKKVEQGKALIVNTMAAEPDVTFTGRHVLPVFHRSETMDISVKTIEIDRRGKEGLICRDNVRADIKVAFFVRVNKTAEDVLKVAQMIGCVRASDQATLEELFNAKFSEALKTVGKQLDFVDLYTQREQFKDQIIQVIGRDLNGYVLEDAAIDFLEQTPITSLDEHNILDAQGIRKITELTAIEHVKTNFSSNNEKKLITKQNVETQEAILELQRQQADAEAKQKREIANIQAREAAEIAKVQAEEKLRAETARLKTAEAIEVQTENKQREVEVAAKNRERVVGVETERVEKDRALEAIAREREVELLRIDKEKALEVQRKEIQEVIRQRISVERAVAEEEEAIKALRVVEEAKRTKEAQVIGAEAKASEGLIAQTRAAEASETAAKFKARERIHLAEAELEAADKHASAQVRLAEGSQAQAAAAGLASARVREAEAVAHEKYGLADAKVVFERMQAEARGKEANASAIEQVGLAEAKVLREKGDATASAVEKQLTAEAAGLAEKAKSMKALDQAGRGHEEFRLKLEKAKAVELAELAMQQSVAEAQARVLAEAFKSANIDIVGGDGMFFDRMINAISMGKAADGVIKGSENAQTLLKDYLSGAKSLPADLKDVLMEPRLSSADVQSLSLAAVLGKLIVETEDTGTRDGLRSLLEKAKSLGLADKSS